MTLAEIAETGLRKTGIAANVALTCLFSWAGIKLALLARAEFAAGGGLPSPDLEGLQAFLLAPDAFERIVHLSQAWAAGVFAAGALYMAALGARWCFHAAVRASIAFKV